MVPIPFFFSSQEIHEILCDEYSLSREYIGLAAGEGGFYVDGQYSFYAKDSKCTSLSLMMICPYTRRPKID